MSKVKDSYLRLYGTSLNETAAGDYIKELESAKTELMEFISKLQEYDFETLVSEQNRLIERYEVKK